MVRPRVLTLYYDNWHYPMRTTVRNHLYAFREAAREGAFVHHNYVLPLPKALRRVEWDAVILFTTLLGRRWSFDEGEWRRYRDEIAALRGKKVAIPQDEYDCSFILDDLLADVGTEVVLTNFGSDVRSSLYPRTSRTARFCEVLTGYLSPSFVEVAARLARPWKERSVDVGYRGSALPFWFGRHGQLKAELATPFSAASTRLGLNADISVAHSAVLYGDAWPAFLGNCRIFVGCEGGSSLIDETGTVQKAIRALLEKEPDATFERAERLCFPGKDGRHHLGALGPRNLECCATRTLQLLVEGHYNGVLEPWKHYIPIKKDLSDVEEALRSANDEATWRRITDQAYADIVASGAYDYRGFAAKVLGTLDDHLAYPLAPAPFLGVVGRLDEGWERVRRHAFRPVAYFGRLILYGGNGAFSRFGRSVYRRVRAWLARTA